MEGTRRRVSDLTTILFRDGVPWKAPTNHLFWEARGCARPGGERSSCVWTASQQLQARAGNAPLARTRPPMPPPAMRTRSGRTAFTSVGTTELSWLVEALHVTPRLTCSARACAAERRGSATACFGVAT